MPVKIHLEGEGLLYDDETSVFNAAQIIGFLKSQEGTSQVLSAPAPSLLDRSRPRMSPREAIVKAAAKTNVQKITVLGDFMAQTHDSETFTLDEVKLAFRKAGESLPKNFSRDVTEAANAGYIYEDEPGQYMLTDIARDSINSGFLDQPLRAKSKKPLQRRTGSPTRTSINDQLFSSLKSSGDKLKSYIGARQAAYEAKASNQAAVIAVWLSDELHFDSISPEDLQTVRRFLGEPAGNARSQLSNAMMRDGFFAQAKEGRFYLSGKGEDFARIHSLK